MADRGAIVTGANTGIGLAIAECLLTEGRNLAYATQENEERHVGPFRDLQTQYGDWRIHWIWGSVAETVAVARS